MENIKTSIYFAHIKIVCLCMHFLMYAEYNIIPVPVCKRDFSPVVVDTCGEEKEECGHER